jgi:hypothetical protein
MNRPKAAVGRQPVVQLGEGLGPDAVQTALGVRTHLNQSRLFEHPEMLGHGRLAQMEVIHELSYRSLPIAKELEDGLSAGLAENVEGRGYRHATSIR